MADISMLSDGQTEVVNLAFVLTILLQLKMLDKVPLYADEIGRTFDSAHRVKVLKFLNRAIDTKLIEQMILVNHFSLFINFSADCDIICLSPDRMSDLPNDTNNCVKLGTN
jgi:ABC-type hemin transport system ATPase subunit